MYFVKTNKRKQIKIKKKRQKQTEIVCWNLHKKFDPPRPHTFPAGSAWIVARYTRPAMNVKVCSLQLHAMSCEKYISKTCANHMVLVTFFLEAQCHRRSRYRTRQETCGHKTFKRHRFTEHEGCHCYCTRVRGWMNWVEARASTTACYQ